MELNLIELTHKYFNLFLTKNPKGLEELYAEDIILTDWNGQWKGRFAVLEMNENIFKNDFHLKIDESVCASYLNSLGNHHEYVNLVIQSAQVPSELSQLLRGINS